MLDYIYGLARNLLSLGVICISSLGVYLYVNQKSLIYPSNMPEGSREQVDTPDKYRLPYDDVWFESKDGLRLHGYFVKHEKEMNKKMTILYCHANAGNMGHRLPVVKILHDRFDANVFIFSYRGYGKSDGYAHEQGMKDDAMSAAEYLFSRKDIDQTKLILFGQSIGGAVAIYIASKTNLKFRALIVENTFLSIPKLIPSVMPIAKHLTFLCTEIWPSEETIKNVHSQMPFLFLSAENDELVPPAHMVHLFELAPMIDKQYHTIKGATHNDPVMFQPYWTHFTEFWNKINKSNL